MSTSSVSTAPWVAARASSAMSVEARSSAARCSNTTLASASSLAYPGWHAEVDGRERPIRAADLAFRAVAVPPGRHTVRFFYRPTSVIPGGVLSPAALLAIVLCLIGLRRRGGSDRAA
jgi:hypothetical protein